MRRMYSIMNIARIAGRRGWHLMKIEPWKRYSEDEYIETVYEYQCPDCNQVIWIANHPVVEEYNYCP